MEFLKDTRNFGSRFIKGGNLPEYLVKLVSFIERTLYNQISKRVNFLLTRVNENQFELVADGNDNKNQDGNWRFKESSGDLIIEKRVSGTWVTADRIRGS